MKILTSFGGPCVYKQGVLPDGTETGRIQFTGQDRNRLKAELLESVKTGRDDVSSFVDRVLGN